MYSSLCSHSVSQWMPISVQDREQTGPVGVSGTRGDTVRPRNKDDLLSGRR